MKTFWFAIMLAALPARAETFHHVTAETAKIDSIGNLTESGTTYAAIFKPEPRQSWVELPAIVTTIPAFSGKASVSLGIGPVTPVPHTRPADKCQQRISYGDDPSALTMGGPARYLGFAVFLPRAAFQAPVAGLGGVQLCQFWQGKPYTPPVSLTVISADAKGVTYECHVYNNKTGGNSSSPPVVLLKNSIPWDTWTPLVVGVAADYRGQGQVDVWQDGKQLVRWIGAVGYDPSTIPFKSAPPKTPNPATRFNVFIGPYRNQQPTRQTMLFDEVKWSDSYNDSVPTR